MIDTTVTLYFDTRRELSNGKYPIKLKVYHKPSQVAKLYKTGYSFSEKDYKNIISQKVRRNLKEDKMNLDRIKVETQKIIDTIPVFSFDILSKKLKRNKGEGTNVFYHYQLKIDELKLNDQYRTAENYDSSLKSIKGFVKHYTKKDDEPKFLGFQEVDVPWIKKYERWMKSKGNSATSIGIYLRPLRHIFNRAKRDQEIKDEIYPFGEGQGKYSIQEPKGTKRALDTEGLKKIKNVVPKNVYQEKAKDFWWFSFASLGMNNADVARLKFSDLDDAEFSYYRSKTRNTSKNPEKIIVYRNEYIDYVIEKYKVDKGPYVFGIISDKMTGEEKVDAIKNFTNAMNKQMKKLAITAGVTSDISSYWARHSFATKSIRDGASMEMISEMFNHKDIKTTKRYFNGFESKVKKEFSKNLMDF